MGNNDGKLVILLMLLTIALFFYISLPFMFRGPAAPLFVIHNHDIKGHEVAVEVFDQQNKSIINETYSLESEGDFSQARPSSLRFHREKREYTFKVTMDKQITSTVKMEIPNNYSLVDIWLYSKDYESGEIVPIFMEIAETV
ncbi:hypothetical protein MSSIT_3431 [Methanosarcina siciliae T4/M]|uniref:Uncharacterized protein n=2 Tax=Methanosarcina siciliae TaxID=38027 RepID=A0A0E3PH01_9EURY|nr:hypothetical protein [Methanosarcina siciliae]AKB30150.1 hypothetical protein MSSIT_3431 [Methanosarcina siciliae T4/M]AKB34052.1 hypothetical protein MSSIH_3362 [Methanosarcina siciliae HI350]